MVALGESTTAGGCSTTPDRCWVPVLATLINDFQSTPMALVNSGIGANVISTRSPSYQHSGKPAADERLDKHVIAHRPDLLIISYGLNDARGGTPLDLFRQRLVDLVPRGGTSQPCKRITGIDPQNETTATQPPSRALRKTC